MTKVAVISFPGTNNEVESVRSIKRAGMTPVCFKWNDDPEILRACDGYFLVGGFSYEDRGRSGMIAARDPIMDVLRAEAAKGKPVIGHCNGAQIVVESGLIPNGQELQMSLARNAIKTKDGWQSPGFRNEWVWITRVCKKERCATSNWDGSLHIPIAHGEGRFTTNDKALIEELKKNDQIAFRYCDEDGNISEDPEVTPNGATFAIAGICNPEGNVIALMPHPERNPQANAYFASLRTWIESHPAREEDVTVSRPASQKMDIPTESQRKTEIFIETIITNNEERTVEQAAKRLLPAMTVKQFRYLAPTEPVEHILSSLRLFNPNKETAYIRTGASMEKWDAKEKRAKPVKHAVLSGMCLLRQDIPDTGAGDLGKGSASGICYAINGVSDDDVRRSDVLAIFGNPHASTVTRLKVA